VLVGRLRDRAASFQWSHTDQQQLLNMLVSLGVEGEFHDYIGAEQAVMAIDGLLIDLGASSQYRAWLDGLYRLVRNDEAYTPESFVTALRELQAALDKASSEESRQHSNRVVARDLAGEARKVVH